MEDSVLLDMLLSIMTITKFYIKVLVGKNIIEATADEASNVVKQLDPRHYQIICQRYGGLKLCFSIVEST